MGTMLMCAVCFAVVCYLLAKDKNRDTLVAAVCGFFFGIFALIYYVVVSKKNDNSNRG